MADQIPDPGGHHIPFSDEAALIPTPAEIAQRERAEQNRREENNQQLLFDLQTRQANAQALQARSNVVIGWLTGVLIVVSLLNGFVAYLQFQAAKENAQAAQSGADAAKIAADVAAKSLEHNIDVSRLDQRAWVGAKSTTGHIPFRSDAPDLTAGQKMQMGIIIANSGKTPAFNVKGTTDMRILPRNAAFSARYRPKDSFLLGYTTLMPEATLAMMARPSDEPVTQKTIDELRAGSSILYLFGSYTYADVSGTQRFLKVCLFAGPDLIGMASCNAYNDAN